MMWIIFTLLLVLGSVGLLAPYGMIGAFIQVVMTGALVLFGINRIRVTASRIRRRQGI
ncbi:MAG TPA: hypothetical protein VMT22_02640 [Terriglobales bacterium]|jgi:hypothetical protein|nr:hypothetical protein [Terriglobales bacterium]